MNRRTFLQSLGLGAIALALKPLFANPYRLRSGMRPVTVDEWRPTAWVPPTNKSSSPRIAENLHTNEARQIIKAWDGRSEIVVQLDPPFNHSANWPSRRACWDGQRLRIETAPTS